MEEVARATNRKVDAGTRPQVVNAAREIWMQARAASDIAEKPGAAWRLSWQGRGQRTEAR